MEKTAAINSVVFVIVRNVVGHNILVSVWVFVRLPYICPYRFGAPLFPKSSVRTALDAAKDPAQVSGECDQQDRGKCKSDIDDARRLLRKFSLANTPPAKKPDHSARCQREDQMQKQVSFKFRTFQLPLPCGQPARNGYWRRERRRHKIIIRGL